MGYSKLGVCLLLRVQCIDALTLHIRALKVYFFANGVGNQLISPSDLGFPDDQRWMSLSLLRYIRNLRDTLFELFIKLFSRVTLQ